MVWGAKVTIFPKKRPSPVSTQSPHYLNISHIFWTDFTPSVSLLMSCTVHNFYLMLFYFFIFFLFVHNLVLILLLMFLSNYYFFVACVNLSCKNFSLNSWENFIFCFRFFLLSLCLFLFLGVFLIYSRVLGLKLSKVCDLMSRHRNIILFSSILLEYL